jgi:ankyrin repeat protein
MDSVREKIEIGFERLASAKQFETNQKMLLDFLGLALLSFHGALEDHFRNLLESSPELPLEQRSRVRDVKLVQWKELINLMQTYHGLSNDEKRNILGVNSLRQGSGHGFRYTGTYHKVEQYARFVCNLINKSSSYNLESNNTQASSPSPRKSSASNPQTPPSSSSSGTSNTQTSPSFSPRSTNTSSNYSRADDLREYSDEEFVNLQGDTARPSSTSSSSSRSSASNPPVSPPNADDYHNRSRANQPRAFQQQPNNVTTGGIIARRKSSSRSRVGKRRLVDLDGIKGCFSKVFGVVIVVSISSLPLVWFHNFVSQQSTSSNSKNADRTLRDAAGKCDLELTKIALREGGKPNAIDNGFFSSKDTALTKAIGTSPIGKKICLPVIKLLLDKKANPNLQGALHLAAQNADLDVIKLLLKKGANPNLDFKSDGIPLSWFVKRHRSSLDSKHGAILDKASANLVLSTLLSPFTAKIDRQDKNGDTLLIKLLKDNANSVLVIQKIIKLGANPKHKNKEGKTAYDYAFAKNDDPKVIKLLNKYR